MQDPQVDQFDGDLLLAERIDREVNGTGRAGTNLTNDFIFSDLVHFSFAEL
jgi:hypothetical protein